MTTLRRQVKNMVKNYSEAEVKVRDATSNDPWGPSSTLMAEISDLTYNIVALGEVMRMIWKRLNDHGKNWRHVYKSLVLLDYLIKNGNEKVAQQCKEHIVAIQTLKDFQYVEEQKDQGLSVREKAKQLVALLRDDDRLKAERAKAFKARERFAQNAMGIGSDNKMVYASGNAALRHLSTGARPSSSYADPYGGAARNSQGLSPDLEAVRPTDPNEEDLQLKLAIMLSQQEHEEDVQRKRADDAKLQLALEQSKSNEDSSGLVDIGDDPWQSAEPKMNSLGDDLFSKSSADPWAEPPSFDPWLTTPTPNPTPIPPPPTKTNPWSATGDPWAAESNTDDLFAIKPAESSSEPDPFGDFFGSASNAPNKASTNPWQGSSAKSEPGAHNFDLFPSDMNSKQTSATRKTPESFLGENSALVNLENLIPTRPKSTNPFGSAIPASGAMTSSSSSGQLNNPFLAAQSNQKPPTINQLQQQSMFQQTNSTPPLIPAPFSQPIIPTSSTNGSSFVQSGALFPSLATAAPTATASTNSTNPFLMM